MLIAAGAPAHAATEIEIWHSMLGAPEIVFSELVGRFNAQQPEVHVKLEYKGNAEATVDAGLAAFEAKKAPDLLQVEDYLSGRMLEAKGAVKPMAEVLPLVKSPDFKFFLPTTVAFMKDARGQLYGFPLLASVPVFFYNKDLYAKAKLDPDLPPKTWRELQAHLLALKKPETDIGCGYTTSDAAWIHVENLGAMHGLAIATRNNGLDGAGAQLSFNDLLHVRHMALMESWVKSELFSYSGHRKEGDVRFASGECATLTSASTALGDFLRTVKFEIGVAPIPFYPEGSETPVNPLVGGSSLLAMGGKKPAEYKAIARFLAFLSTPVIAAEWHQKTGSLPLTGGAFLASEKSALYDRMNGFEYAMRQVATSSTMSPASRGIRLPEYDKVRKVIERELEEVWVGTTAPKKGLDDAVRLGNAAMLGEPLPVAPKTTIKKPVIVKKPGIKPDV